MEFEIGKLYVGTLTGIIVRCIENMHGESCFSGVVVYSVSKTYSIGFYSNMFYKCFFEEYASDNLTLLNGHKYSIPKGCKATIKDNVVIIEEDIEYSKSEREGATVWTRTGINAMQITCWNGLYEISMMNIGIGNEPSTKEEFEEAYQNALGALKLK